MNYLILIQLAKVFSIICLLAGVWGAICFLVDYKINDRKYPTKEELE